MTFGHKNFFYELQMLLEIKLRLVPLYYCILNDISGAYFILIISSNQANSADNSLWKVIC